MMTTIRLYGILGARFGRVHRMDIANGVEAIRALASQLPGFQTFLVRSKDMGLGYTLFYGKRNIANTEELGISNAGRDIRIAPVMLAAKKGGIGQILLGTALILVAVFAPFTAPVLAGFMSAGIGMVVGGVVQLIAPTPGGKSSKDKAENQASAMFNGPINTQAQGTHVPLLYGGPLHVGSAVISAGISAEDYIVPNTGDSPRGGGGGGGGGSNVGRVIEYITESAP